MNLKKRSHLAALFLSLAAGCVLPVSRQAFVNYATGRHFSAVIFSGLNLTPVFGRAHNSRFLYRSRANRALALFSINMSHYSEKICWLLDYEEIPYQEIALTPALHTLPMWLKGRRAQTMVPLLQSGKICIQDSPRIINWLAEHHSLPDSIAPARQ